MNKKEVARGVYDVIEKSRNSDIPQEVTVNIRNERKKIPLPPTIMVFQAAAYLCATKLNASTNRVLMYFFSKSVYENYIGVDVKTLMEELEFSKPTVVKALKQLEGNNIILKYKNVHDRRRHDYFINPVTAWKGNSFTRNDAINNIKDSKDPGQLNLFGIEPNDAKAISPNKEFDK